jgi:hypothetical protein
VIRPLPLHKRLAFRWAFGPNRRSDIKTAALLAGILIAYAIAGTMDYRDALISEAQAQEARADQHAAQLLACINGGMSGLYSTDSNGIRKHIVCDKAWEVSDEAVKP